MAVLNDNLVVYFEIDVIDGVNDMVVVGDDGDVGVGLDMGVVGYFDAVGEIEVAVEVEFEMGVSDVDDVLGWDWGWKLKLK